MYVRKDTKLYKTMGTVFEQYGIAVSILNRKLIFLDYDEVKDLTENHILAIEAHELGHYIAHHSGKEVMKEDEIQADAIGIQLLLNNDLKESAQLLIDRLEDMGVPYKTYKLSINTLEELKQYIK